MGGSLRVVHESLYKIADELPPLFIRYGKELGTAPTEPNWHELFRMQASGILRVVTARQNKVLAGFCFNSVGPHLMYRTTIHGITFAVWLDHAYRTGWTGVRLLVKNRDLLREWGVKRAYISEPFTGGLKLDKVYKRIGYEPAEMNYAMRM